MSCSLAVSLSRLLVENCVCPAVLVPLAVVTCLCCLLLLLLTVAPPDLALVWLP